MRKYLLSTLVIIGIAVGGLLIWQRIQPQSAKKSFLRTLPFTFFQTKAIPSSPALDSQTTLNLKGKFIYPKDGFLYSVDPDGSNVKKITFQNGESIPYTSNNFLLFRSSDGRFITFIDVKNKSLIVIDLSLQKTKTIPSLATSVYLISPIKSEIYYKKADTLYAYDMVSDTEYAVVKIGTAELTNISKYGDKIVLTAVDQKGSPFSYVDLTSGKHIPFDSKLFKNSLPPFFAKDKDHVGYIRKNRLLLYQLSGSVGEELYFSLTESILDIAISPTTEDIYFLTSNGEDSVHLHRLDLLTSKDEVIDTLTFTSTRPEEKQRGIVFFNFLNPRVLNIYLTTVDSVALPSTSEDLPEYMIKTIQYARGPFELWRYDLVKKSLRRV